MALFLECNFPEQGFAFVFQTEAGTLGDRGYYYYYYYFACVFQRPEDRLQAHEHARAFHRQQGVTYFYCSATNQKTLSIPGHLLRSFCQGG